jgi:HSP20 family protein
MTDLVPWGRRRNLATRRSEEQNPIWSIQREMNRMFDDVLRGFDLAPFGGSFEPSMGWPSIEVNETEKDVKVTAELPGLDEKDVQVEFADGVLSIKGEIKTETEDKERRFSERYYGRFERHVSVGDVDPDKVSAAFKKGVLTVTMPKLPETKSNVKRIAINGK